MIQIRRWLKWGVIFRFESCAIGALGQGENWVKIGKVNLFILAHAFENLKTESTSGRTMIAVNWFMTHLHSSIHFKSRLQFARGFLLLRFQSFFGARAGIQHDHDLLKALVHNAKIRPDKMFDDAKGDVGGRDHRAGPEANFPVAEVQFEAADGQFKIDAREQFCAGVTAFGEGLVRDGGIHTQQEQA